MRRKKSETEKINAYVFEIIGSNLELKTKELAKQLVAIIPRPEDQKLRDDYYNDQARRFMAKYRDQNNARDFLASRNKDKESIYINISTTKDLDKLTIAENQVRYKFIGLDKTLKKIQAAKIALSGQLALWDEEHTEEFQTPQQ